MFNAKRFKKELYRLDMSQRELADRIGVTEQSVSRYIHGTRKPRKKTLVKMAEVFGKEPTYFLEEDAESIKSKLFHSFLISGDKDGILKSVFIDGQEMKGVVSATVCVNPKEIPTVYLEMISTDVKVDLPMAAVLPYSEEQQTGKETAKGETA